MEDQAEDGGFPASSQGLPEEDDFDLASALHRVGGSMELLREVGGIFFQGWDEREPILKQALLDSDAHVLREVAHKIKGAALNLSASSVAEHAGELEARGLQLRLEGADAVMERLVQAVRRFRTAFQEDVAAERVTT